MTEHEVVIQTDYKREKGYIYPTGSDANGNLVVYKVKAGRHRIREVKDEPKSN
jgi:hypothetical protein